MTVIIEGVIGLCAPERLLQSYSFSFSHSSKGHSFASNQNAIFILMKNGLAFHQLLIKIIVCITDANVSLYLVSRFWLVALLTSAMSMR
jgi:hypothetical protein